MHGICEIETTNPDKSFDNYGHEVEKRNMWWLEGVWIPSIISQPGKQRGPGEQEEWELDFKSCSLAQMLPT